MGIKTKIRVHDLESLNIDKFCAIALEIEYVHGLKPEDIEFVRSGDHDLDVEGDLADREYWKCDGRSMTEMLAIRHKLGTSNLLVNNLIASDIVGLVALCESLAKNHGKTGKGGGQLYKKGTIPMMARNLAVLPAQAMEIAHQIVIAISKALKSQYPVASLMEQVVHDEQHCWERYNKALADAEYKVHDLANAVALDLSKQSTVVGPARFEPSTTKLDGARRFALTRPSKWPIAPEVIELPTTNPNLMKHLWASCKLVANLRVAAAVVINPETGRIAVMTSKQEDVDIRPVVAALHERFPGAEFDANLERGSIIWDPRFSSKPGPDAAAMLQVVCDHLFIHEHEPVSETPPTFKVTLADRLSNRRV